MTQENPKKVIKLKKPKEMLYYVIIETSKQRDKFIKRVERICRSSMEYKDYIQFLKDNIGLDSCLFFMYVSNEKTGSGKRVRVELHHEPLTLYDYVSIVVTKFEKEGLPYNDLLIADEVMKAHAENGVGIIPLSKTCHEVIHNSNKLFIPLNFVYGNYKQFLEEYDQYVDDEIYDKIEAKLEKTKTLTPESFDALKKEFRYYEVEGYEELEKIEVSNTADEPLEIDEQEAEEALQKIVA